jgi:hypothetical protein
MEQATWTMDVGGKQDYDGSLVVFGTRYYPPHKQGANAPKPHSVMCSIWLHDGDKVTVQVAHTEVWGDTEAEAKAKAEAWVASHLDRVHGAIRVAYGTPS